MITNDYHTLITIDWPGASRPGSSHWSVAAIPRSARTWKGLPGRGNIEGKYLDFELGGCSCGRRLGRARSGWRPLWSLLTQGTASLTVCDSPPTQPWSRSIPLYRSNFRTLPCSIFWFWRCCGVFRSFFGNDSCIVWGFFFKDTPIAIWISYTI